MTKRLLTAGLLLFILASCSSDSEPSKGGKSDSVKKTEFIFDYEEARRHISYRFVENGCTTEKQTFESEYPATLKGLFGAGLQDNKRNNSCAESHRKNLFDEKCFGYASRL